MLQDVQVEIIEDLFQRIETKSADLGEEGRESVDFYLSQEQLQREKSVLFTRYPLVVGFSSQLRNPGDFITHGESGVPLIVVRKDDGALAAYINACRHRGTRLEEAPCGEGKKAFTCPYHAWTYDTHGRLRGVPHPEGFPNLVKEERALVALPVGEHGGLVYVVPTPGADLKLQDYLEGLPADLETFGFSSHVLHAPSRRTRKMNWKLLQDGSFEAYHFRTTHAQTIYPMFYDNLARWDWQSPHLRGVLPKRTIEGLKGTPQGSWALRPHANILYGIFPNTIVLVQPDHAMVVQAWPQDVDSTLITGGMLIPEPPADERAAAHWAKNEKIFWMAIEEDIDMAERIHATLRSGANQDVLFGRYEHLVTKYHQLLKDSLRT